MFQRLRAGRINRQAIAAEEAGRCDEAEASYRRAMAMAPRWAAPWYNLGLLYKRQRRWPESLRYNLEALARDGKDDAIIWNTGIAATAVGDWRTARDAWQRIGYKFPDGKGFVDLSLGTVAIRINPDEAPEVLPCARLDPVRARILVVPTSESKRRYGDVVLNDGAPRGERIYHGERVPVLDELALLEPSSYGTFSAVIRAPGLEAMAELEQLFATRALAIEDWGHNVRMLCRACSEGRPAEDHAHPPPDEPPDGTYRVGIAARDDAAARDALDSWCRAGRERSFESLERLL